MEAIFWFCAAVVLLVVLILILAGKASAEQERPEPTTVILDAEVTPVPTPFVFRETLPPEFTPAPETWVHYDVDLDDDLQRYIEKLCREYELPASVVMAVIVEESGCDPNDISDEGKSFGLMNVMATEHTDRCIKLGAWNLLDPYQNVRAGIDFLAELVNCGHGMDWALSWYNGHGGDPCDYAWRVLTRAERLMESAQLREI